jgi:hypothetical protein
MLATGEHSVLSRYDFSSGSDVRGACKHKLYPPKILSHEIELSPRIIP